jgi:hypothetical protein
MIVHGFSCYVVNEREGKARGVVEWQWKKGLIIFGVVERQNAQYIESLVEIWRRNEVLE